MKAFPYIHRYQVISVRGGPDAEKYGDPYTHFVDIVLSDPPEIIGLTETPSKDHIQALGRVLWRLGINGAFWKRIKNGREHSLWIEGSEEGAKVTPHKSRPCP